MVQRIVELDGEGDAATLLKQIGPCVVIVVVIVVVVVVGLALLGRFKRTAAGGGRGGGEDNTEEERRRERWRGGEVETVKQGESVKER